MNCYDWIEVAKNLADHILQKYIELCNLDLSGLKNTKEYQEIVKELKALTECENTLYSMLKDYELDFIHKNLIVNSEIPIPYSITDILAMSMEEVYLDDLIYHRVYEKIVWYKIKKDYPVFDCEIKQVGMIPLLPFQKKDDFTHYTSKIAIIEGCFNMFFSQTILQSNQYSERIRTKFLYFSSYCDMDIENYYLQTMFTLKDSTVKNVLEFYENQYLNDQGQYDGYCFDLYGTSYFPYIKDVLEYSKEELDEEDSKVFDVLIVRDMFYSYMNVISFDAMKRIFDEFTKMKGNPSIKNYLMRKMEPLVVEKNKKVIKIAKQKI